MFLWRQSVGWEGDFGFFLQRRARTCGETDSPEPVWIEEASRKSEQGDPFKGRLGHRLVGADKAFLPASFHYYVII